MIAVAIAGAGPAGSAAAIAAALAGAQVSLCDPAKFPRHKVCGEFLSPEILRPLEQLGLSSRLLSAGPAVITRLRLRFPSFEKTALLPEPALGLSRFTLDRILLQRALELGVALHREAADRSLRPLVDAAGRHKPPSIRGRRLFGFKTHYEGPPTDGIELYFFANAYVGVSCVEAGRTNVCGIAQETLLQKHGFEYDALVNSFAPLRERLTPLQRTMDWLSVGPLQFTNRFADRHLKGIYPAGDALSFVDPFTGTGLAAALISGQLAGVAAASGEASAEYLQRCRRSLGQPFAAASAMRAALQTRWAELAALIIPTSWLVSITRPRIVA